MAAGMKPGLIKSEIMWRTKPLGNLSHHGVTARNDLYSEEEKSVQKIITNQWWLKYDSVNTV